LKSSIKPKFEIDVDLGNLAGPCGNVFVIVGVVSEALKKHGVPHVVVTEFLQEVTEGDYDHALDTCRRWVNATWICEE